MKRILLIAALTCMAILLALSCRDEQWDKHGKITEEGGEVANSLLDAIKANPDLSSFLSALESTGTDSLLLQSNNFTVFAPVNSAWKGSSNAVTLRRLVRNHIAYEKILTTDNRLTDSALYMVNGKAMRYDGQSFNGAKITSSDKVASNGVLHITDAEVQLRSSVWEYISSLSGGDYNMVGYLKDLNRREMDKERSIFVEYDKSGNEVYDTVWKDVNSFLTEIPLNNEQEEYTIVVLRNASYNNILNMYKPYLKRATDEENVQLANFNLCSDLVFEGNIDITQFDTAYSVDNVQVILNRPTPVSSYQASNGRVYILDNAQIPLHSKIKPVVIEGENFSNAYNKSYIYTRYRPAWASGGRDIMLSCSTIQSDTVFGVVSGLRDSVITTTFNHSGDNLVSATNFWIEFDSIQVYSTDYEIYYVAHNDILSHAYNSRGQKMRLEQKLFISLPERPKLSTGVDFYDVINLATTNYPAWISNNYLGNTECFVGLDTARGILPPKETQLRRWKLAGYEGGNAAGTQGRYATSGQTLKQPVTGASAYIMTVDRSGLLTMRLCNTPRLKADGTIPKGPESGMMFLDYIKLVPKIKE